MPNINISYRTRLLIICKIRLPPSLTKATYVESGYTTLYWLPIPTSNSTIVIIIKCIFAFHILFLFISNIKFYNFCLSFFACSASASNRSCSAIKESTSFAGNILVLVLPFSRVNIAISTVNREEKHSITHYHSN